MIVLSLNAVLFCLTIPHLLYAFIWYFPRTWMKLVGRSPVEKFAQTAGALKIVQFGSVLSWISGTSLFSNGLSWLAEVTILQWLGFLGLLSIGQTLNGGVLSTIGIDGTYYGFKLGKKVPWYSGFPFSVCPHPQYVGSSLSVWAFFILLHAHAPPALLSIALYWTGLYVVTGIIEEFTS